MRIYLAQELPHVARELWDLHDRCKVYTLTGPLGAGKTTLVREILRCAGVKTIVSSPTFTYVNIYKNDQGQTFYHFDAYRIDSVEQFQAQGFDEYLYAPNSWAFIEWPEKLGSLIHRQVCHITLDYVEDGKRALTYTIQE